MIIDIHTHVWADQTDADVDAFVRAMDERSIDISAVLAIAPYVSNEGLAKQIKRYPDRLVGFASVAPFGQTTGIPREDPLTTLERAVQDLGMRGLKLHPTMQGFALDDPGLVPIMRKAAELGIPVLFHTGPTHGRAGRIKNAMIEHIDDLAIMCPDTVIIAGHGEIFENGPYIAAKHPNVYLDTAITWSRVCPIFPGLGESAIDVAGPDKILFATDANPRRLERFDSTLNALGSLDITEETRSKIMGANAARILGLAV